MPRYKRPVSANKGWKSSIALPPSLNDELIKEVNTFLDNTRDEPKSAYMIGHFLSKYVGPETDSSDVRRQRAIEKWLATELRNSDSNHRLLLIDPDFEVIPQISHSRMVKTCRRIISTIIGEAPIWTYLFGGFSGGASTSKTRDSSCPALKFLDKADVTEDCYDLASLITGASPLWSEQTALNSYFNVVHGNVLFTVPKSTKIDRVACKEPDMNMFMQKGVGNFIRKRLKKFGINLNDQSINQELSRLGSKENHLATLDLSSASDSICTQLVYELLPIDWFILLDRLRSKVTMIDGELHENHMFSSMGNGFTFELESLIFYAITRSVAYLRGVRGSVSVYGDDIICPCAIASDLINTLEHFGFSTNVEKSFVDGPIRESCGAHWYTGYSVTPFYHRSPIVHTIDLIHFLNSLRKWGSWRGILDERIVPIWLKYAQFVPPELWGGQDYSCKYALVSGDRPRSILVPHTTPVTHDHIGGYLHWLQTCSDRSQLGEPIVTSTIRLNKDKRYRLRRNEQTVMPELLH